jgi:hypothetical protein
MAGYQNIFNLTRRHRLFAFLKPAQRKFPPNHRGSIRCAGFFRTDGLIASLIVIVFLLSPILTVTAQGSGTLEISGSDTQRFPVVTLRMDSLDEQGQFISGMTSENIQVLEDGTRIRPQAVEVTESGLQVMLALNLGPAMGNQIQGASQFDHLRQVLLKWVKSRQSKANDYLSMSTPTGLYLIYSSDPKEWAQAIEDYQPDFSKVQPNLNSLAEALNLSTNPEDQRAVRQAIVFITPPISASMGAGLPALSERAKALGVRVFVWLVTPSSSASLPSDAPLRQLAETTGGTFQQIYPPDSIPDLESQLAALRQTYLIHYLSEVQKSGEHPVRVEFTQGDLKLVSNVHSFPVTVLPPNPIFLSPPEVVERGWQFSDSVDQPAVLKPNEVPLEILVEYPDAHNRSLTRSRLFVDGQLVVENTQPPYDRFQWPVKQWTESGQHLLRVEVEDDLGLIGSSLELPVKVKVAPPLQTGLRDRIAGGVSSRNLVILGSVMLSGTVLLMVLFIKDRKSSRLKLSVKGPRMNGRTSKFPAVSPQGMRSAQAGESAVRDLQAEVSPARFVSLNENQQPIIGAVFPILGQEMTFGSDPNRATQVLESPTVDGLHARVYRRENGNFYLADGNTVAGTWINYAPITAHGARLEHGDLVHMGRSMFRFELTDSVLVKLPEIKVYGPENHTS